MLVKTTMRYHFSHNRVVIIKKRQTIANVGKDVEKLKPSCIAGGNVNGIASLENSLASLQMLNKISI